MQFALRRAWLRADRSARNAGKFHSSSTVSGSCACRCADKGRERRVGELASTARRYKAANTDNPGFVLVVGQDHARKLCHIPGLDSDRSDAGAQQARIGAQIEQRDHAFHRRCADAGGREASSTSSLEQFVASSENSLLERQPICRPERDFPRRRLCAPRAESSSETSPRGERLRVKDCGSVGH